VFGIPFYTEKQRFDLLENGIKILRDTWKKSNPKPVQDPMPLLIGGKGQKRTLPLVAREAAEWNLSRLDELMYLESRKILEKSCRAIGRDAQSIRNSVMTSYIIGRTRSELRERAAEVSKVVRALHGKNPDEVIEDRRRAWFVGTPEEIAEKMRHHASIGVDLFMLQHFLLDDADALKLLAERVIPAVA
jgi:alkanesulfonate monooxygenase SsuD/methylene tetrahydromethanopterin reductase-like flavin-dependent oxidoreductase (luciferase family)